MPAPVIHQSHTRLSKPEHLQEPVLLCHRFCRAHVLILSLFTLGDLEKHSLHIGCDASRSELTLLPGGLLLESQTRAK